MENAIRSKHFRPGDGTTFEPGRTSTTFSSSAGDELNALPFIDSAPAQTNAAFQVGGLPGWWATDLEIAFEHRDRQIGANPLPTTLYGLVIEGASRLLPGAEHPTVLAIQAIRREKRSPGLRLVALRASSRARQ